MSAKQTMALKLFYCYAHADESFRQELEEHLAPLKRQRHLVTWSDREVSAGTERRQEIETHLMSAHLILLLISPSFLDSDACDEQMRRALALGKSGHAQVVPILVRPVVWQQTPLADLQLLPANRKPIKLWEDRDEAWQQVVLHIGQLVSDALGLPPLLQGEVRTSTSKAREPAAAALDLSFEPRNPYKGLRPFTEKDVRDFFGRESLVEELLEHLHTTLSPGGLDEVPRLLTVFGPSGSGKSSVIMAGLLPALQRGVLAGSEHWTYLHPISPGVRPLESLTRTLSYHPHLSALNLTLLEEDLKAPAARGLQKLTDRLLQGEPSTVVLFIDQFEELFTQTLEKTDRTQFINLLVTAITEPRGPLLTILSLRADFYDRPMHFRELFRLMHATQVPVLPLTYQDLRHSIKKPADLPDVQLQFEDDLVGELLADMHGQSGVLPLLQFTMDRLFQKRQRHLLTVSAYHDMGGLQGALAQHAEATYDLLPADEYRDLTKLLFLRLVEPSGIDQDPTRCRIILGELVPTDPAKKGILEKVVDIFTAARLLTTSNQQGAAAVEVSHEALIRGWPRLAQWLHGAYEDLLLQRRLREDAAAWERAGRPVNRLYRDGQLEEALAWQARSLPRQDEQTFLQASIAERERQRAAALRLQQRVRRRTVLKVLGGLGAAAGMGGNHL